MEPRRRRKVRKRRRSEYTVGDLINAEWNPGLFIRGVIKRVSPYPWLSVRFDDGELWNVNPFVTKLKRHINPYAELPALGSSVSEERGDVLLTTEDLLSGTPSDTRPKKQQDADMREWEWEQALRCISSNITLKGRIQNTEKQYVTRLKASVALL